MRKPDFRLCENKNADQLCIDCEATMRLCFRLCKDFFLMARLKLTIMYASQSKKINEPVLEKINNLGSDQVRHKPGCTITEAG